MKLTYKQYKTNAVSIPKDWKLKELGSIVDFLDNSRKPINDNDRLKIQGNIPYYGASGIVDYINDFLFDEDLILLGEDGENIISRNSRLAFKITGKSWVNNHAHVLRVHQEVDINYLSEYLESLNYEQYNTGTAQPKLNKSTCLGIPVLLPPRVEQHAIATALKDMDALLESLNSLITKKRAIKQATMQKLLSGHVRLPGFNDNWTDNEIGNLANIQRGASPRPIDDPRWFDERSTTGWVRISDITSSNMYLNKTSTNMSQEGVSQSRLVKKNNLIMSICATIGRPIITKIDACIHDGFIVFGDLRTNIKYMYHTLKWMEPTWSKHGQTGSQTNLNTHIIKSTTVHLPPEDEQMSISSILDDMDTEVIELEVLIKKMQTIHQSLMQELLTGRSRLI